MPKAIIAMSGGVDSSVAAKLMKDKGYECISVTMKLFSNCDIDITADNTKTCCSLKDVEDARKASQSIGIAHYVLNFQTNFKDEVIEPFISSYEQGLTPNPCIDCNRYVKFEKLYLRTKQLGFEYLVTGHYARVEQDKQSGRYLLKKALDDTKDQSYVLYSMTQDQLKHTIFPLGELRKTQVREIAAGQGLVNANKQDSQDICFVPNGDYFQFIKDYTGKDYLPGDFVDTKGNVLGKHKGIVNYTIGQRKGLGLSLPQPMYVVEKNIPENKVILGLEEELYCKSLIARDVNWIAFETLEEPVRAKAKTRYRQQEQWCTVSNWEDGMIRIDFDEPQRAITPGQAVVMYDGDVVIGGGTIEKSLQ